MNSDEVFLTPEGADKLRKELEALIGPKRREMAERLRHAVQQGDLTENADYITAKEQQAFLEGKILELEQTLRRATILDETSASDAVVIGSTVKVSLAEAGPQIFRIVGIKEADPRRGMISHQSPYAQALLGKHVGDTAIVHTPSGTIELKVLEIR